MNATPSPLIMSRFAPPQVAAQIAPSTPTEASEPVRTKHLEHGQVVRAWFNGEAHGGERIVATVEPATEDGSMWTVTFSSLHPTQVYRAAYRWEIQA